MVPPAAGANRGDSFCVIFGRDSVESLNLCTNCIDSRRVLFDINVFLCSALCSFHLNISCHVFSLLGVVAGKVVHSPKRNAVVSAGEEEAAAAAAAAQ